MAAPFRCALSLLLLLLLQLPVNAEPVWISQAGVDQGLCPITAPCATLQYALAHMKNGGAVQIIGPYDVVGCQGACVINKSVTIIAAPGQVIRSAGCGHGFNIQIAATDTVILDGIDLTMDCTSPTDFTGINFLSGGQLKLRHCTISGFARGLWLLAENQVTTAVSIDNCLFARNGSAILNEGGTVVLSNVEFSRNTVAIATASAEKVYLDRSRFLFNAQVVGGGTPVYSFGNNVMVENGGTPPTLTPVPLK